MQAAPRQEQRWLERLVGDWTFETISMLEPGDAVPHQTGTERMRSIGGGWIVGEGHGQMPDGGTAATLLTLGYDPARGRFVGSFAASMMAHLWIYDGALDAAGEVLTLDTEGPSFAAEGEMGRYRDVLAFETDDRRVLTSHYLDDAGRWQPFMTTRCRRAP